MIKKQTLCFLVFSAVSFLLLCSACANRGAAPADVQADAKLKVDSGSDTTAGEGQAAVQELQEKQRQEQRRQLERQINDPLVNR